MANVKLLPAIGLLLAGVGGCGDGPICQSEILLLIQTPQSVVLDDTNDDMAGVQTDVTVRSTLPEDVIVDLTVFDAEDDEVYSDSQRVDENGDVTFEDVVLPDGAATIRVAADAGECGSDEDEVVLDVAAGRDCVVLVSPEPLDNDYYDPRGVLSMSNDPDPAPDFQVDVEVSTMAGYDVELFVTGDAGEISEGTETADDQGAAAFAVTLGQGGQSLRAVCTSPGGVVVSPSITMSVFVDTVAPLCAMTDPFPGDSIGTDLDADSDPSNGLQITLSANATGGDVEGEAATFAVTVAGATMTVPGTDFDGNGNSSAAVTIDVSTDPATVRLALSGVDHAGNSCDIDDDYDIDYLCPTLGFGEIGGGCANASDCGPGETLTCYVGSQGPVTFAPEGYCMVDDFSTAAGTCDDNTDCPAGTECTEWLDLGGYKNCLPSCSCTVGPDTCPDNQACFDTFNGYLLGGSVCVPGDENAVDGSACNGLYDCNELSTCFDDLEFPGGMCQRYGCTVGNAATCNGGHCINAEPPFAGTTCVDTCTSDADCRTGSGYVCYDPDGAGSALNYCRHPHVGDACTTTASCGGAGWVCKTGGAFTGGYCTAEAACPTPGSLAGCTDGSICFDDAANPNYCVDRCAGIGTQSTCRSGYTCVDTNGATAGGGGCVPM